MNPMTLSPMVSDTVVVGLLTAVASIGGAVLIYFGARFTASRSKEAATQATAVDAQNSAVEAWKELLEPYRQEVAAGRKDVADLRAELEAERTARADAQRATAREVEALRERVGLLNVQLTEWKQMARVISKWAVTLRDEVLKLGGTVPATPEELLTIQAIDDASSE